MGLDTSHIFQQLATCKHCWGGVTAALTDCADAEIMSVFCWRWRRNRRADGQCSSRHVRTIPDDVHICFLLQFTFIWHAWGHSFSRLLALMMKMEQTGWALNIYQLGCPCGGCTASFRAVCVTTWAPLCVCLWSRALVENRALLPVGNPL